MLAPVPPPLYKNKIPEEVNAIAPTIGKVIFSLKNTAIMTATITGYTNRIVHAIPDSI